jgi:hypothetical protein
LYINEEDNVVWFGELKLFVDPALARHVAHEEFTQL